MGYNPSYKWDFCRVNPLITGVITHLLSGMSHQVPFSSFFPHQVVGLSQPVPLCEVDDYRVRSVCISPSPPLPDRKQRGAPVLAPNFWVSWYPEMGSYVAKKDTSIATVKKKDMGRWSSFIIIPHYSIYSSSFVIIHYSSSSCSIIRPKNYFRPCSARGRAPTSFRHCC